MKRNFSWENFGIDFLKAVLYHPKTPDRFRLKYETNDIETLTNKLGYMCACPDERFVRRYKDVIADEFFANSVALVSLFKTLERNHYSDVKIGTEEEMLNRLRTMRLTSTVITAILTELYRKGRVISEDAELAQFAAPKTIDLTLAQGNEIPLRPYQQEAADALKKHFVEEDKDAGVLVMPTGSGKTRVAVSFLLNDMVANGWQVIWLTHRAMLIDQTAEAIYSNSPVIKLRNQEKNTFKMVCVSGSHSTVRATAKDDDVIIFGVQALIRNLPYLQGCLKDRVMIIVDEMHHSIAPSYQTIIQEIRSKCAQTKLLGLTATPVRMQDYDTARLMKLFGNIIIYSVSMNELIVQGILSTPEYISVDTDIDFSLTITVDEEKYMTKWGELSPELLERMTNTAERNKIIVDTYLNNKEKFGKTLVFALNAEHCISLSEDFRREGVKSDYLYYGHTGNDEKLQKFKNGELDVLVNINICSEGTDIPDIQTVFLCRPTGSDVLLMQCIGRGMRGVDSGGTEKCYIVSFNDVWGRFNYWLNPQFIIDNELADETSSQTDGTPERPDETYTVPWEAIRYLLDNIKAEYEGQISGEVALPAGWIDAIDTDGADRRVLVFESQLSGYKQLRANKDLLKECSAAEILDRFFPEFGLQPSFEDIQILKAHYEFTGEFPHIYPLQNRKQIDAGVIAKQLMDENTGIADMETKLKTIFEENSKIINSIYGSYDQYRLRIFDFLKYKNGIVPVGMKIEELPDEMIPFEYGNAYDLQELVSEVKAEMFDNDYEPDIPVRWTKRPYKMYFGQYKWSADNDLSKSSIQINCILNSKQVNRETVKLIIYHELLHRDNHSHNKEFYFEEHKFPNWTEHNRRLYNDFAVFDISEW